MKYFSFVITILLITLAGCEDNGTLSYRMSATIDGNSWRTLSPLTVLEEGYFVITGTSTSGEVINITIKGMSTGTYKSSETNCVGLYYYANQDSNSGYISTSGTVELTDVNTGAKKISGAFSFLLKKDLSEETVEISNGVFDNVSYIEY